LAAGAKVTCNITNIRLANITVEKVSSPRDCTDFEFSLQDDGGDISGSPFHLDDDQAVGECIIDPTDQPKNKTFVLLTPNQVYNVTEENIPAFWTLDSVECTSSLGTSTIDNTTISNGSSIHLAPGDWVTCIFYDRTPAPTRTQGFYKTHTNLTTNLLLDPDGLLDDVPDIGFYDGLMYIGNVSTGNYSVINSSSDLFGAYFSWIPRTQDRTKRDKVDKVRMVLIRQLVTAKLNCRAFGCPIAVIQNITLADNAFSSGDIDAMRSWAGSLDVYNNSGDTLADNLPYEKGKATPKLSKIEARKDDNDGAHGDGFGYWDVMPEFST
jgi:hypothetical protein